MYTQTSLAISSELLLWPTWEAESWATVLSKTLNKLWIRALMISVFLSVYKALKQERPELMALMYSSQGMLAWSMHFFFNQCTFTLAQTRYRPCSTSSPGLQFSGDVLCPCKPRSSSAMLQAESWPRASREMLRGPHFSLWITTI